MRRKNEKTSWKKKVKKVDFFLKTLQKKKIIKSWKKVEEKKLGTKVKIVLKKKTFLKIEKSFKNSWKE